MFIINKTKKRIIVEKTALCRTVFKRAAGLMLSKKENKALIFIFSKEKIVPLHMLFVFYPIDVLFLNKEKKIVEIKEHFRPFSFYSPKNKARYIIEMPEGSIGKFNLEISDKLSFDSL